MNTSSMTNCSFSLTHPQLFGEVRVFIIAYAIMVVASDSPSFLGKYRLHCGAIILLIMSLISLMAPYHVLSPVLILLMSNFDGSLYDISVIVISLFPLILFVMLVIGLIQAISAKNVVSLVAPVVVVTPVIISVSVSGPDDVYRISFMSFNLILMTWIVVGLIQITKGGPPNIVILIAATIVVLSPLLGTFMYARDFDGYRLGTLVLYICIATGLVRTTVGRHSKKTGSETDTSFWYYNL